MNASLPVRLLLDSLMLVLTLLGLAYQWTENTLHEIFGFVLLAVFVLHLELNWWWIKGLARPSSDPMRKIRITLNVLLFVSSIVLFATGVMNSRLLSLPLDLFARNEHAQAAYWFLTLISLHLGLHWRTIMRESARLLKLHEPNKTRTFFLRVAALFLAVGGLYAFWERDILAKLTGYYVFDFWDFDKAPFGFFAEYLCAMALCAIIAHYTISVVTKKKTSSL